MCLSVCVPVDPQTGTRCRSVSVPDGEPWLCSLTARTVLRAARPAPCVGPRQHRGAAPAVTCSKSRGTPADAPQTGGSTAAAPDVRAGAVKTVVGCRWMRRDGWQGRRKELCRVRQRHVALLIHLHQRRQSRQLLHSPAFSRSSISQCESPPLCTLPPPSHSPTLAAPPPPPTPPRNSVTR